MLFALFHLLHFLQEFMRSTTGALWLIYVIKTIPITGQRGVCYNAS